MNGLPLDLGGVQLTAMGGVRTCSGSCKKRLRSLRISGRGSLLDSTR